MLPVSHENFDVEGPSVRSSYQRQCRYDSVDVFDPAMREPPRKLCSVRYCFNLREVWEDLPFWKQLGIGTVATIALLAATVVGLVLGKVTERTEYEPLSELPAGCLGPPYILVTFHGGRNPRWHHRYDQILKYTRDGCLLGRANQDRLSGRLRGMRVFGDNLYVVRDSTVLGAPSNVIKFGGCAAITTQQLKTRATVNENFLKFDADSYAPCLQHPFDIDSPDDGRRFFVTDQLSGYVTEYNSEGLPRRTSEATNQTPSTSQQGGGCSNVVANITTSHSRKIKADSQFSTSHRTVSEGIRGLCFDGVRMFLPYKFGEGVLSATLKGTRDWKVEGSLLPKHRPSELDDTTSKSIPQNGFWLDTVHSEKPTIIGAAQANLTEGIGWMSPSHAIFHSPTVCSTRNGKLYTTNRKGPKHGVEGVVEYNLQSGKTRLFTSPELVSSGFVTSLAIYEDALFVAHRASLNAGVKDGQIALFNITTGTFVRNVVGAGSFPDLPEQIILSPC